MSTIDEADKFFDSDDFNVAFESIGEVILRLQMEHRPTDNMDCLCGEKGAFSNNNLNPLTNEHLSKFYLLNILYTFEKYREDVIRIDPGDDDPLQKRSEKSTYDQQKEAWMRYVSGTRYPFISGTSSHGSSTTLPTISASRGGVVYGKRAR